MENSKQTGSEIAPCTQSKKPLHPSHKLYDQRHNKTQIIKLIILQRKARHLPLSVLVSVASPQSGIPRGHRV